MNQEERTLRSNIRDLIRIVKQKKANEKDLFENNIFKLATLELEKMLLEGGVPDVDPTPNKSTGINVLEELLKKIVPVLETDFKSLTTNGEQRVSFRAHIVNAVVKTLTPAIANNEADPDEKESAGDGEIDEDIEIEEDVSINIIDDLDDDKFIDIRTDAERKRQKTKMYLMRKKNLEPALKAMIPVETWHTNLLRKLKLRLSIHMNCFQILKTKNCSMTI